MLIAVRCTCGRRLKVTDAKIGKPGNCPACHAVLRLVAPEFAAGRDTFDYALVIAAGPERVGEVILLAGSGPVEIGKLANKHLVLVGKSVSRGHCRLVRSGDGGWSLEDQRSTNGIFVNGQRVSARDLRGGDRIRIGEYELRFTGTRLMSEPASVKPMLSGGGVVTVGGPPGSQSPALTETSVSADEIDDDSLYKLSDGDVLDVAAPEPTAIKPIEVPTGGPTCPSCGKSLAPKAKICVTCGIDLKTGRAIITSHGGDLDAVYANTEGIVRWLSWIVWFGLYPVASEGFGLRKPYFTRAIVILTVLVSAWFWAYEWTDSPQMASMKNYMLWVGQAEPSPGQIWYYYRYTSYGDTAAFDANFDKLEAKLEAKKAEWVERAKTAANKHDATAAMTELKKIEAELKHDQASMVVAAHEALPPDKQFQGRYSPMQLVSHAFLHGGIFHLVGNMLFLLVIGSRINALVGNLTMIVLYPALAALAGLAFMASQQGEPPLPCVGASGAIMGLAGMYLILMPIHKIHMAAWWRCGLRVGFQLMFKLWSMRGFWVVLFYIIFDVIAVLLGSKGGVAHWAHLGGFIAGMVIGLMLLFLRLVNCRGGDIVSGLLGRHAWGFVGKPDLTRKAPLEYGW